MKKQNGSAEKVWLGFNVKTEGGPVLRPTQIHFWKEDEYKSKQPESPLHYHADALCGLALVHLNQSLKSPFTSPKMNYSFCTEAWLAMEPHHELFQRSQTRVSALRRNMKEIPQSVSDYFERNFTDILDSSLHPWGIDLTHLEYLIESIEYLETKMEAPLLYNFNLKLSKPVIQKLHHLHSFLFSLRSLMAVDYNSFIQDPSHEACKVDSITDYLSKAEYVANDGLLYQQFKKQKGHMPPETFHQLEKAFKHFSHNGYCLVEGLPKSFLESMRQEELEEALYIAQMDWLLGTEAGLLFRIREELYGLIHGYEKIFWPEMADKPSHDQPVLSISCQIEVHDLYPTTQAA